MGLMMKPGHWAPPAVPGDRREQRCDLRPRPLLALFSLVLCSWIAVPSCILIRLVYLGSPSPPSQAPFPAADCEV